MTTHTPERRAQWRAWKAAQRARDQAGSADKRRTYYAKNRETRLEYQRRYYHEIWKPRDAGVTP